MWAEDRISKHWGNQAPILLFFLPFGLYVLSFFYQNVNAKETGSYYTPDFIAQYIVDTAIHAWLKNYIDYDKIQTLGDVEKKSLLDRVKGVRILDPAVGDGVFLCAAADSLLKLRRLLGDSNTSNSIRHDIVNCLYGVDIVEEAVRKCTENLENWIRQNESSIKISTNVKFGNSLIGFCGDGFTPKQTDAKFKQFLDSVGIEINVEELKKINPFHWEVKFPDVMKGKEKGFDIVVGNPPYGNILSVMEREIISKIYPYCVGGSRGGTWNSAAHFVVRAKMLLRDEGQLGLLLPNSVLRVGQFTKTRDFLLNEMTLHEIVDEGRPFPDVTLEMVSVFCTSKSKSLKQDIKIISRRKVAAESHIVPWKVFNDSRIFVLYFDSIYQSILKKSERHLLTAGRGRDIPANHVSDSKHDSFQIPYATSGRSVQRYRFDYKYIKYTDNWYESDTALSESYSNEFIVATKNLPYPRCVMKPKGILHGGGIVRIKPLREDVDIAAIGLILNSNLMKYICIRYLTNYSELTTCMNTGIMEELPIILPKNPKPFTRLFRALEEIYSNSKIASASKEIRQCLENVSDALVYALYLLDDYEFIHKIEQSIESSKSNHYIDLYKILSYPEILQSINRILQNPVVISIEKSPRMD